MKVVVLAGGTSTERDVSLSSGSMIYRALKKKGHQAVLLDVYLGYEGKIEDIFERETDWAAQTGRISEKNPDLEAIKALRPDGDKNFFGPNVLELCGRADVVFMALHGATERMGKYRHALSLWAFAILEQILSARRWRWIKASQRISSEPIGFPRLGESG